MTGDGDEQGAGGGGEASVQRSQRAPLRALRGGGADAIADSVRLRREFKGPTVADLLHDDALAEALPGRARSALQALERGDLQAAEAELPGAFDGGARVMAGPGHRRARAGARARAIVFVVACAVLVTLLLWFG